MESTRHSHSSYLPQVTPSFIKGRSDDVLYYLKVFQPGNAAVLQTVSGMVGMYSSFYAGYRRNYLFFTPRRFDYLENATHVFIALPLWKENSR